MAQIFGSNLWLVALPIHCSSGAPHGDGITFGKCDVLVEGAIQAKMTIELSQQPTAMTQGSEFNQDYFVVGQSQSQKILNGNKRRSSLDQSSTTNYTYIKNRNKGNESPGIQSKISGS